MFCRQHWYLAVIHQPGACLVSKIAPAKNEQKTLMILFDSLVSFASGERHQFTFNLLQHWLKAAAAQQYPEPGDLQLDASRVVRFEPKSPQQQNGVDCGVFMIKSLAYGNGLRYALCSMQGWRISMENAHTALLALGVHSVLATLVCTGWFSVGARCTWVETYDTDECASLDL